MPPDSRPIPRFAADLPREGLPSGDWEERLRDELLDAAARLDDVGEVGEITWFPERGWAGRCFVPATARTSTGLELFGYVSYRPGEEPHDVIALADVTEETAEAHPEWKVDLCDEVVGSWRGEGDARAQMTLVWGTPLIPTLPPGSIATAELGGRVTVTVDQCPLYDGRFTLLAPDDYRGDTLSVSIWDARAREVARESLYDEEG
ncbi:MAG TPA: hypothetical protein VHB30_03255 [Solirubrobacteraceae bacterium]|jgi:hypothetical protein|nr:hypothetical protein [Solirubrobacteraceae bacterium]